MNGLFHTWPTWASRSLAILLLLGLIAAAGQLLVLPAWRTLISNEQQIVSARRSLNLFQDRSSALAALQKQLKVLQDRRSNSPIFLRQNSPALAGAWLQQRLKQLLLQHGGQAKSMQIVTRQRRGAAISNKQKAFPKVIVRVRFRANLQSVMQMLHALEAQTPYLIVDRLELRSIARYRTNRRQRLASNNPKQLETVLDVAGYVASKTPDIPNR